MRLTSVVLTSWISSITSKISWIVGWPWSNHVCVCVCERERDYASVSVCDWFYKFIHGLQKQILVFFVWKFGFWPGEVMEKSWNFFLRFLLEPCLWNEWGRQKSNQVYFCLGTYTTQTILLGTLRWEPGKQCLSRWYPSKKDAQHSLNLLSFSKH